jgi:hypothetical protein
MPSEDVLYLSRIQGRIRQSLSLGGRSFREIVRGCQGAYPTVVLELLQGAEPHVITKSAPMFYPVGRSRQRTSRLRDIEGNPILSSWYFTDDTCRRLGQLRDWSKCDIAFLGTPRLFEWFVQARFGRRRVLLEIDKLVLSTLANSSDASTHIMPYNANEDLPAALSGRFDCVIFDPPWYPKDYELWLSRASQLARTGLICFSLFPELTRPTGAAERSAILQSVEPFADSFTLIPEYLEYEVPSFEAHELAARGLSHVDRWKLSDLVICWLKAGATFSPPAAREDLTTEWVEIDVGALRLFVNPAKPHATGSASLLEAASDGSFVLPSPSRRDPVLASVNFLSSRGHGLVCSRPVELISCLETLRSAQIAGDHPFSALGRLDIDTHSKEVLREVLTVGRP